MVMMVAVLAHRQQSNGGVSALAADSRQKGRSADERQPSTVPTPYNPIGETRGTRSADECGIQRSPRSFMAEQETVKNAQPMRQFATLKTLPQIARRKT